MTPGRSATLVLLAGLLVAGCTPAVAVAPAGDIRALEMRNRAFLEASSARDAERLTSFFAEDAVLHVGNRPAVHGGPAIERFYGNVFRFLSASTATPETLRVGAGGGMALATGRVTNVFRGAEGDVEHEGKYLLVWERRDGEWVVVAYSLSSDRDR